MMIWLIVAAILVIVGFILDREIFFYEGGRFGPRLQAWLYDRWSRKYDEGKRDSQLYDAEMLAQPLLQALTAASTPAPFVLDFAAGTGRLSFALMSQPEFKGRIIAVDLSQGMLERAASKLSLHLGRVELLRHRSLPLPFPDAAFDAICALEVLELFPNMDQPLAEFRRLLRPGGILLASRSTEESGRKAKVKSAGILIALMEEHGFEKVQISKWWKLFDRVIAVKSGSSHPATATSLSEVLKCPACRSIDWAESSNAWRCRECGKTLSVTKEGLLLN